MANSIKLKRSAVPGKVPTTGDLSLGELAVNTYDGVLYSLLNDGTNKIVQLGGRSVSTSVTAGTNSQGQGVLTSNFNIVTTTASNPSAVTLPAAILGSTVGVTNRGTNAINVYPASGSQIDSLGTNAAISIPVGGSIVFTATSSSQWFSTASQTLIGSTLTNTVLLGSLTANGTTGSSGQLLSSTGSGLQWVDASGTTVTNDTTTNASYYPTFATTTSGAATLKTSSTGIKYNPSSSLFTVSGTTGRPTLELAADTNTSPSVAIELRRGTNTTWGADNLTDYRLLSAGGNLTLEHGLSTVTTERVRLLDTGRFLLGHTAELTMPGGVLPRLQVAGSTFSNSSIGYHRFSADTSSAALYFSKSRNATVGSHTIVNDGDTLGVISFSGSDGSAYQSAASISASCEGTPGASNMPGRVDISTTPAGSTVSVSRFRVRSDGNVTFGGTGSSGVTLNIAKDSTGSATYTNLSIFNTVRKDVTGGLVSFSSFPGFEAAPFSLPYAYHYIAGQSALSSGPIIDLQAGFRAYSFLTGANNNWGFSSNIAAPVSGPAGPFTVNTVSCSGTTVTLDTTAAHSLVNGQTVSVSLLVNATALVTGVVCTITTVGTTDFTLIGAASNTVGLSFTATGAGTGTGTVTLNCQGGGITVGGSSGTTFTYTTTVSATFASVTVATGTVIVSKRYNFYAEGTADNFFAGDTGFGVLNPTEKVDVLGKGLFRAAADQDGILLSGRAGGSGGFTTTLIPTTLTASRTITIPNVSGTVITTGDTATVTNQVVDKQVHSTILALSYGMGAP